MKAGKILIILLSISINLILYATEQESDYIKINDIEHKLFTNPINQLLQFEDFQGLYCKPNIQCPKLPPKIQ